MREEAGCKPTIEECRKVLESLVRVNTCQPEGNEGELVDLIRQMLPEGIECRKIEHTPQRASMIVKVEGETEEGGLALIGHLDTVACSEQDGWAYPPHQAEVKGDILYGRGAADMKGGDAAMILALQQIAQNGKKPKRPIYFCFTADEESKGLGICSVVEEQCLGQVEEVIICEPSDEKIGICEKGALWLRAEIRGKASHASRPELGDNAVEYGIHFANRLREAVEGKKSHSILGEDTVSVTRFGGGVMTNIIPASAQMELDIRTIPGTSHDDIIHMAQEICRETMSMHPAVHMTVEVLNNRPALETPQDSPFVRRMLEAAESVGISTKPKGLYFYTDASQMMSGRQLPFVIAGPGDDALAHCVNEHISLSSVARYTELYSRYIMEYYYE